MKTAQRAVLVDPEDQADAVVVQVELTIFGPPLDRHARTVQDQR